jgi:hypothetical protein
MRTGRGRLAHGAPGSRRQALGLAASLGASALALEWLAGSAPGAEGAESSLSACVLRATPALSSTESTFSVVAEEPAAPVALVPAQPVRAPTPPLVPGRGSLDVTLTDIWGETVALGPFDSLTLEAASAAPDDTKLWFVQPDASGHIVVPGLWPGRYVGTLSTGIVGRLERTDLVVSEGDPTSIAFRYVGPVLERRIAIRVGYGGRGDAGAQAHGMQLHGAAGSVHLGIAQGPDLVVFDDLPPGRYDLEVRANPTQSYWLRDLQPGTFHETLFDRGMCWLEASPAGQVAAR